MKRPIEIRRGDGRELTIVWSNGEQQHLTGERLRTQCPCAACREARGDDSHAKPLTGGKKSLLRIVESSKVEEIALDKVWPVGNYAIGIRFGDGHDSGIFTFEYLVSLAANTA